MLKGVTITEKRSKFEGHCAVVRSPDEAEQTVRELVSEKKYADATHNIWVCRVCDESGRVCC